MSGIGLSFLLKIPDIRPPTLKLAVAVTNKPKMQNGSEMIEVFSFFA
jgi:hypothetical protein